MENRHKFRISKIFQSTFNSCRPKNNSDVADGHVSFLENPRHRRLIDLFSPKPQPLSSTSCNPKLHLSRLGSTPYRLNTDHPTPHSGSSLHEKTSKRCRSKKPQYRRRRNNASFSSLTDNYYSNWWSSDDDGRSDGQNTLFSRQSFSSESLKSVRKIRAKRSQKDVVAVAKQSSDPHEDFKASMVDMIVEKGIFRVEELENLVECFLSLNSEENHKVIIEVFAEIWETLISRSDLYEKE